VLPVLALFSSMAMSAARAQSTPVSPTVEPPEAARYVLLKLFHGQAVYEEGNLKRREIVATYPSTYGLPPDHPLVPLFLYQAKLFDTHERLVTEDPAYRELVESTIDKTWYSPQAVVQPTVASPWCADPVVREETTEAS